MTETPSAKQLYKLYWKQDLLAAISVSLVALPLSLGIAIASNSPPISGLIAAIVGGLLTTFIRRSHVTINGPTASLIVVILSGNQMLADADGGGFKYVLAAICMAGALQILIGLFKMGRLADFVPDAVVEGMLAAIGLIIFAKQAHIGLGVENNAESAMTTLLEIPKSIFLMDPKIALITALSILVMVLYPKVNNKLFHYIPAPVWVLIFTIPAVFLYRNFFLDLFDITAPAMQFPASQLIDLPENLWKDFDSPDFSKMGTGAFWLVVISITIIASIESMISTSAIDNLDPLQRKTDPNKDLMAVGFSTIVSGLIGGLPVINVIVRSSVNINNNAKTRLSNFFHGAILLILLLALKPVVEEVPLAALAAILIYTGYKLASPKQFATSYEKGEEQLLIMVFTVITVLIYGLLWGIALGIGMAFLVQWIKSRMSMKTFVMAIISPRIQAKQHESQYEIRLSGVFNFLNLLKIKAAAKKIPRAERAVINMEEVILADFSVMSYLSLFRKNYEARGGKFSIEGLDNHESTSSHPNSMRMLQPEHQHSPRWMTDHQRDMMRLSAQRGWQFVIGKEFGHEELKAFPFFKSHPVEYVHNTVTGLLPQHNLYFTLQDIVFDEGALAAKIAYDATVIIVELQKPLPAFVLEKEELYDKIVQRVGLDDIDFPEDPEFSDRELLRGTDRPAVRALFNAELRAFILSQDEYHVESCSDKLLIFKKPEPLSHDEMEALLTFSQDLITALNRAVADVSATPVE